MMWLRKILAFFSGHPCTDKDWYQLLAVCFQSPHAYLRWTLNNNRPEMQWQQGELSLLRGLNSSGASSFSPAGRRPVARHFDTFSL
ncbi:MAG TPA: hypothetical protein VN462_08620 [Negativicutes bacterium]|nr:hypothetical protein [Negativicutes bacterium]